MNEPDLESRYRRLLSWYPWSHRRVYEEEMLAVLVSGARPGQRRPTIGETANLIVSGLETRAQAAITGFAGPAWIDAAAVMGLLAALVLLSQDAVRLLEPGVVKDLPIYLRTAGWAMVVLVVTLLGMRRPAAVLAWAIALGESVLLTVRYENDPVSTVHLLWPLVLALTAAAALTVPAAPWRAVSVLRARLLVFVAGIGLIQTIVLVNAYQRQALWRDLDGYSTYVFYGLESPSDSVLNLWLATIAVGALLVVLAVLTLPTPVRLRVVVLLAPVVTLAAMVELTLGGWSYSNSAMGHPIYLVPVQWTLLAGVPLAVLAIGALLVQRRETTARLTALGRAVDRERIDPA